MRTRSTNRFNSRKAIETAVADLRLVRTPIRTTNRFNSRKAIETPRDLRTVVQVVCHLPIASTAERQLRPVQFDRFVDRHIFTYQSLQQPKGN